MVIYSRMLAGDKWLHKQKTQIRETWKNADNYTEQLQNAARKLLEFV